MIRLNICYICNLNLKNMIIWIGISASLVCGWVFRGEFNFRKRKEVVEFVVLLLCVYTLVRGLGGVWEDLFM